jgi:peptidoglycan/LPS O-acetylase OafA/YrhL
MPALDGLRAISIALVLLGHLSGTRGFPKLDLARYVGDYANLGVTMFFVISGYLISTLLVEESQRFGNISLRLFYTRRVLRLFPAFLLFALFLVIVQQAGWIRLNPGDLTAALTYTVNFRSHSSWYIGHLWSLSVEEQFYLLWPALLAIAGCQRSGKIAVGVLLLSPAARLGAMLLHLPGAIFPCVADSLACGCLLALCGDRLLRQPGYRRLIAWKYFLPVAVTVIFGCNWTRQYVIGVALGVSVINLVFAVLIHRCVVFQSATTRFLTLPPLVGVGVLSYSLYLWQQFFLNQHSSWAVCQFPTNLFLAIGAATASYYCVERPLNELRRKLRRRGAAVFGV